MSSGAILVTGGCRGIGRGVVEALVRDGVSVAFTFRSGQAAARELENSCGRRARAYHLDLQDHRGPDLIVPEIEKSLGPVLGLVNNAGIRREALLAMTSDKDWEAVLDTNLGGAFRCCRAVLPGMVQRREGSIVNIASLSAFHGISGQAAYAASKAGIIGLTRSLAREVGKRNIRVNAVVPGFVATDLTSGLPQAKVEALRSTECLPEGVCVESIAESVLFLLSDKAASITGHALVVDAGSSS